MYALAAALTLAAVDGAGRVWAGAAAGRRPDSRLYVVAMVGLIYTHFLGWLVLVLINLVALAPALRTRAALRPWLATQS